MKEIIVKDNPKSAIAESIKNIKTNLRFSSINKKLQTILITSSFHGEGKSFISANLAATYVNVNDRVLLIDCDMRRGRQREIFEIKDRYRMGLSNLLIDSKWRANLDYYIYHTSIKNLDVLTAGSVPPNPNILLESLKIEKVFEELKKKYDIIILDAPPVGGLADALILSRLADVVLIVARAEKTSKELLKGTKEALDNVNANIAGVVLNGSTRKYDKYYSKYYEG